MDFKKATDRLFLSLNHNDLAGILGVSVPAIRQARLVETAKAYRSPPTHWKDAVLTLALDRAEHYRKLVADLNAERIPGSSGSNGDGQPE